MKWQDVSGLLRVAPRGASSMLGRVGRLLPALFVVALVVAPGEVLKQCESLLRPQHQAPR